MVVLIPVMPVTASGNGDGRIVNSSRLVQSFCVLSVFIMCYFSFNRLHLGVYMKIVSE